jgi:arginyl-tRNA synthetase
VREQVQKLLAEAVERAVAELDPERSEPLPEVQVAATRNREHGDFACNAAMMLARPLRRSPLEIAERIVAALRDPDGILDRVEVARPGFINCQLARAHFRDAIANVLESGADWGRSDTGGHERATAWSATQSHGCSTPPDAA